jgi:hypothetical protein
MCFLMDGRRYPYCMDVHSERDILARGKNYTQRLIQQFWKEIQSINFSSLPGSSVIQSP